jgi:hypothetical protein
MEMDSDIYSRLSWVPDCVLEVRSDGASEGIVAFDGDCREACPVFVKDSEREPMSWINFWPV